VDVYIELRVCALRRITKPSSSCTVSTLAFQTFLHAFMSSYRRPSVQAAASSCRLSRRCASPEKYFPRPLLPLLVALLMRWRLIPQHSPCCSSSRLWWPQHDVGFVASADSSEISNSVPACARAALQATHTPHANRRVRAITLARMAVACEQAENAGHAAAATLKNNGFTEDASAAKQGCPIPAKE
jgi:hypothetical protein